MYVYMCIYIIMYISICVYVSMHTAVCMYSTIMISFRGLRPSNTPRPCVPFRPSVPEGEWAKPLPPQAPQPQFARLLQTRSNRAD